jgi:nicotinamide riboside kinase
MIKRINIFGGAGVGKSTLTAKLFSELKRDKYNIEHVTEYIKNWVYESRIPQSWDQLYILGQQLHREDLIIRQGPSIITDSPLLMQAAYSQFNGFPATKQLIEIVDEFEKHYNSINFFIHRKYAYVDTGRFHSEETAILIENNIIELLTNRTGSMIVYLESLCDDEILNIIKQHIISEQ